MSRSVILTLTLGLVALLLIYYASRWPTWNLTTRVTMVIGLVAFSAVLAYADYLARAPGKR